MITTTTTIDTATGMGPVLVTGGASGIGLASARAVAAVGRAIALWDLDTDRATEQAAAIATEFGVAAVGVGIDVTDSAAFADALDATRAVIGPVGAMVHAAGVVSADSIGGLSEQRWDFVLDVNLRAFALLGQAIAADLAASPGAAIVGIASIEGLVGHPAIPAYCASKAGLIGLVRSMAASMHPVRVNAVCPGYVETPMLAPSLSYEPMRQHMETSAIIGRLGRPEEIGAAVRFLLCADASFITGTHLVVDGGTTAVR
jgi:NAD(P)-dependent dehydrogenase (short-subunit alcohol dehydrogenase family)